MTQHADERNGFVARPQALRVVATDTDLIDSLNASDIKASEMTMRPEPGTMARRNLTVRGVEEQDFIGSRKGPAEPQELAAFHPLADARKSGAQSAEVFQTEAPGQRRRLTLAPVDHARGKIIATIPARGGIGATTLSVNLAERLAEPKGRGKKRSQAKVALVDLDIQFGAVGSLLDLAEQDLLARLASEGAMPDETLIRQAMFDHPSGLRVLPAPVTFVPQDALNPDQIAALLDCLRNEFDFVVVDLPHAVARWIEPVISRADLLLLVADSSVPSIRQARRLVELLTADNVSVPVQVVAGKERRPVFRSASLREAEKALERRFWSWLPPDERRARSAADQGRPLSAVGGKLARAIDRLARQVERDLSTSDAAEIRE